MPMRYEFNFLLPSKACRPVLPWTGFANPGLGFSLRTRSLASCQKPCSKRSCVEIDVAVRCTNNLPRQRNGALVVSADSRPTAVKSCVIGFRCIHGAQSLFCRMVSPAVMHSHDSFIGVVLDGCVGALACSHLYFKPLLTSSHTMALHRPPPFRFDITRATLMCFKYFAILLVCGGA